MSACPDSITGLLADKAVHLNPARSEAKRSSTSWDALCARLTKVLCSVPIILPPSIHTHVTSARTTNADKVRNISSFFWRV